MKALALAGLLLAGAGALGIAVKPKAPPPPPPPPSERGYRIIDCSDVEITDADKAYAYAHTVGATSTLPQLQERLGDGCALTPRLLGLLRDAGDGKVRFLYELARHALASHVQAGGSAAIALLALAQFRSQALNAQIDVSNWPTSL